MSGVCRLPPAQTPTSTSARQDHRIPAAATPAAHAAAASAPQSPTEHTHKSPTEPHRAHRAPQSTHTSTHAPAPAAAGPAAAPAAPARAPAAAAPAPATQPRAALPLPAPPPPPPAGGVLPPACAPTVPKRSTGAACRWVVHRYVQVPPPTHTHTLLPPHTDTQSHLALTRVQNMCLWLSTLPRDLRPCLQSRCSSLPRPDQQPSSVLTILTHFSVSPTSIKHPHA